MRLTCMRFTVRGIMYLVVVIAFASALGVQIIRSALLTRELSAHSQLLANFRRAADRMHWAERMHQKGYVSKAQFDFEKAAFRKAANSLRLPN